MEEFRFIGIVVFLVITLPFLILGIVLIVLGKIKKNKVNQQPAYEGRTVGTITGATRKNKRLYKSVISFTEICYKYSINDMIYESEQNDMRPLKGKRYWSKKAAQEAVDELYPVGQQVTVYYNMDAPDQSYLLEDQFIKNCHVADRTMTICGWIFLIVVLTVVLFLGSFFLMFECF